MNTGLLIVLVIAITTLSILCLVAQWKIFKKAGKPGWVSIVPFYSSWTLAKIGGKPGWWGLIAAVSLTVSVQDTIPLGVAIALGIFGGVVTIFWILISLGVAKNFGRSTAFGFFLGVVPFAGYPILAWTPNKYKFRKQKEQPALVAAIVVVVALLAGSGVVITAAPAQNENSVYSELTTENYINGDIKFSFSYPAMAKLDEAAIKGQQVVPSWFQTPLVYDSKDSSLDPNVAILANYADISSYLHSCQISSDELLQQLTSPTSCFITTINNLHPAPINKYLFANCDSEVINVDGRSNLICSANYPEQDGTRITTMYGVSGNNLYFLQLAVSDSVWQDHTSVWSTVEKNFTY